MKECKVSKKSPTTYRKTILHIYQSTSCSGLRYPTSSTSNKIQKKHPTIYRILSKNSWTSIKKNIPPKVIPTESSSWWNLNRRRLGQNGIHSIGKSGDLRSQQSMNGCPPCCWSISWQQFVNVKKTWKQNKTKRDFISVRVL